MAKYDGSVYLYLTTAGRYSGRPREIEIWFTRIENQYYLIAELGEKANWVKNIRHDNSILFRIDEHCYSGRARIVDDIREPDLAAQVRAQSEAKYGWSEGLIVALQTDEIRMMNDE